LTALFFSQTAAGEHKAVSQFAKGQCGTQCNATIFVQKNAQFIQAGNAGRRLASSSGTGNSTDKPEETQERASGRLFCRERYHDVRAVRLATDERCRASSATNAKWREA